MKIEAVIASLRCGLRTTSLRCGSREGGESPACLAPLDLEGRRFAYAHQDTTLLLKLGDDGVGLLRRMKSELLRVA